MAILKLPNVGDEATFKVAKCEVVESANIKNKDGSPQEQVKFTASNGDQLFVGRDPADRALSRIGFADGEQVLYGDVDGWTLRFYRVKNTNPAYKPFWNIDKVTDEAHDTPQVTSSAAPAPAKPQAAPSTDARDRLDAIDRAYAHAYVVAQRVQGDETSTPDSLQAGAATLLIAYDRANLLGLFTPPKAEEPKPAKAAPAKAAPAKRAVEPSPHGDTQADYQLQNSFEGEDDLPF